MRNVLINTFITTITLIVLFFVFEICFRVLRYEPFVPATFQMRGTIMEPKPLYNPDTLVGVKMDSGTYKIYFEDGYAWQATNNSIGYRITSFKSNLELENNTRHIDIFGCSFTYGTGLADAETYPFLLQGMLPNYRINNYAVPGHGIAHNFTKLTKLFPPDSLTIVVYAYIRGHDFKTNHRNRKIMYPSRNFMKGHYFLYLTESLDIVKTQYDYKPMPFIQYSSLMNFLEDVYLEYKDNMLSKHQASKNALLYMDKLCRERSAKFIFVTLTDDDDSKDLIQFCRMNKISAEDISLDITNKKYNLEPHDNHPNFEANKIYANRLFDYLFSNNLITK